MKFPSIDYLVMQAGASFRRFYLPLLFAVIGTFAALAQIEDKTPQHTFISTTFTCSLAMACAIGCRLFSERTENEPVRLFMFFAPVLFAIVYYIGYAPDDYHNNYRPMAIYSVLSLVMHFWVAIAAYKRGNEKVGFWRFNETLYSRMILSVLFSVALYVGLALALLACNLLLKFTFSYSVYLKLWVVIIGIFNTWFFLAGVPGNFEELNIPKSFPPALKVFTQYILMPIVTIYMVILYLYMFKIVCAWELPKGWVSSLIIYYSVLGILALLLVNPLRNDEDASWVRLFSRFFYIASLPLVVLLWAAVNVRISRYGITETRYFLVLIALWLSFISIYFICFPHKNIRVIPVSLAITGTLSLIGPWNAFSVANRSQLHRLEKILLRNKIWSPGTKVANTQISMKFDDDRHVRDIIGYFVERRDIAAMQEIFAIDLQQLAKNSYIKSTGDFRWEYYDRLNLENKLMAALAPSDIEKIKNMVKSNPYPVYPSYPDLVSRSDLRTGIDVSGYSRVCRYRSDNYNRPTYIYKAANDSLAINITEKDSSVFITLRREGKIVQNIDLSGLVRKLRSDTVNHRKYNDNWKPLNELTLDASGAVPLRILINEIVVKDARASNNEKIVKGFDSWILVK